MTADTLDDRLRAWTERAGSHAQAARQIGLPGRNPAATVRRWALGDQLPALDQLPADVLERLAAQLGYRSLGALAEAVVTARDERRRQGRAPAEK